MSSSLKWRPFCLGLNVLQMKCLPLVQEPVVTQWSYLTGNLQESAKQDYKEKLFNISSSLAMINSLSLGGFHEILGK